MSEDIIKRIVSILPPYPSTGNDKINWIGTSTRSFSMKSACRSLHESFWYSKDKWWKVTWKFLGPQRVQLFLWLVFKQRLLTNMEWIKQDIGQNGSCSLCGHGEEDLIHVLKNYSAAREVWFRVILLELQSSFFLW